LSISSWRLCSLEIAAIHGDESCGVTVIWKSSARPMTNGIIDRLVCGTSYPASRTRRSSHEALNDWRWSIRSYGALTYPLVSHLKNAADVVQ
jgi:hypothetical protein